MSRTLSRREFISLTAKAGIAAGIASGIPWSIRRAIAFSQSPTNIRKFVVNLPGAGPAGANSIGQYLPLATKQAGKLGTKKVDIYNLTSAKFTQTMHPDLPGPTTFYGYGDNIAGQKYLGGVIISKRGTPTIINMANHLPANHFLPFDPMLMAGPGGIMTGDLPQNRTAVHLHGGFTPWFSDGTPHQWFSPAGMTGPSFMNIPGLPTPAGSANYYYPNDQSARMLWYHDHAMGETRLNAYAGLASAYFITDDFESGLVHDGLLPDQIGIPLVIQDKGFVSEDIETRDPSWDEDAWGGPGSLWYPHEYEANTLPGNIENPKGRFDYAPTDGAPPGAITMPLPPVSIIPEAFLDTILVNGGLYPVVTVPPKRVRFRMLNAAQARFFHLNLYREDPAAAGEALVKAPGPKMFQIGSEGGFAPFVSVHHNKRPIPLDLIGDPSGDSAIPSGPFNLLLAPAERADIIIDFNKVAPGTSFILYNDAPAPFPGGDSRNDYYTGSPDQTTIGGAPSTVRGYGPNTRTLMKIMVGPGTGDVENTNKWLTRINARLRSNFLTGNQPGLLFNSGDPSVPAFPYKGVIHRQITLNEDFDDMGRLIQRMGTMTQNGVNSQGLPTWGLPYDSPATETPAKGATEVWQIFNLTMDVHPIHVHLVNAQLIQRQPFTGDPGTGITMSGPPRRPDDNEIGWKETIRVNPMESATIIMKFDLPVLPTAAMRNAVSPRTGGAEYVFHCHILEHEEHDMMRPLIVR